jgi:hypothetical protein
MPAKDKLLALEQILAALREQGRAFEKLFGLVGYHRRGHRPGPSTPEEVEFVTDMMRAWNRPLNIWEAEALRRLDLQEKNTKREVGLVTANQARRRKAESDHQRYRKIAEALASKNPKLSRHRLAALVRANLTRQGQKAPSVKTISTALKK